MLIGNSFSQPFPEGMPRWLASQLLDYYANLALILAGVCIFVLLFQFPPTHKPLLWFAPAGKMTLTFYIAQSLMFVPFFYGFGLGAYGFIGQASSLALGIACWIVQMFIAWVWLKKWRYGPLEWMWRRLTFIGWREHKEMRTSQ